MNGLKVGFINYWNKKGPDSNLPTDKNKNRMCHYFFFMQGRVVHGVL